METRLKLPYIGAPAIDRDTRQPLKGRRQFDKGVRYIAHKIVTGINFTGNPRSRGRERTKIILRREKVPYVTWSIADQAAAVKRGVFIERASDDTARVHLLPHCPFKTDKDVMDDATRRAFLARDAQAIHMLAFVAQQDQYRWTGVWETKAIELCIEPMVWLQRFRSASHYGREQAALAVLQLRPGRPPGTVAERLTRKLMAEGVDTSVTVHPELDGRRKAKNRARMKAARAVATAEYKAMMAYANWMAAETARLGEEPEVSFKEWRKRH